MQPNSDQQQRGLQVPNRGDPVTQPADDRQAALSLVRQQIDQLYGGTEQPAQDPTTPTVTPALAEPTQQAAAPVETNENPYAMTHSDAVDASMQGRSESINSQWQAYHSEWQRYYQMYYDRYYQAQIARSEHANPTKEVVATPKSSNGTLSKAEAVKELRAELTEKVKHHATKARKSRHFMPIIASISVACLFLFLQYNQLLFAQVQAFMSPGVANNENIYIDPTNNKVGPDPKILIPKINVDAPVVYDVTTLDEKVVESKLKDGVVHYPIPGANALPGQVGNTVLLGHSSNDVFDDGKYKFVFVQLDRLEKGDKFYLNYNGTRYTYQVTDKKIIDPTAVSELVINNGKPLATLVTCTPPGTALQRLMVVGEQIDPDPSSAGQQSTEQTKATSAETKHIAGAAQSFFERLFNVAF